MALLSVVRSHTWRIAVVRSAICIATPLIGWFSGLWQGELFPGALAPQLEQFRWICSTLILALLLAYALGSFRTAFCLAVPSFCLLQLPSFLIFFFGNSRPAALWAGTAVTLSIAAVLPYYLPPGAMVRPRRFLGMALWFALLAGLVENGIRWVRNPIYGPINISADDLFPTFRYGEAFWLVPLSNVVGLVGLALVIALPGCLSRRWQLPLKSIFVILFVAGVSLTARAVTGLDAVALFAIAAGGAVTISRSIVARPDGFGHVVRRTLPVLLLATVGLGIFGEGRSRLAERRQLDALPRAAKNAPNVLLIVLDTVRAQSLSLYGYSRSTTPRLVEYAARGVAFDRAMAPSSWTLPTHASVFTGRMPHEHKADAGRPLDGRFKTIAEAFSERGYQTSGFIANWVYCGAHTGLARGYIHYDDHDRAWDDLFFNSLFLTKLFAGVAPDIRKTAVDINREFLGWLAGRDQRPFFAFLNYYDAHEPYHVPDASFDRFGSRTADERQQILATSPNYSAQAVLESANDTYDGSIAYLDHHLGLLLDELDRQKILENTCVIITSDHGQNFGEQGGFGHGWGLYRQQIGVPLLILQPAAIEGNKRVNSVVNLVNLPATIFELAGIQPPSDFGGSSLGKSWRNTASISLADQPAIVSELLNVVSEDASQRQAGPVFSFMAYGMHYIAYLGTNREELFDLSRDARELRNLAGTDFGRAQLPQFRDLLHRALAEKQSTASLNGTREAGLSAR